MGFETMYAAYPASAVCSIASAAMYAPAATSAAMFVGLSRLLSQRGIVDERNRQYRSCESGKGASSAMCLLQVRVRHDVSVSRLPFLCRSQPTPQVRRSDRLSCNILELVVYYLVVASDASRVLSFACY